MDIAGFWNRIDNFRDITVHFYVSDRVSFQASSAMLYGGGLGLLIDEVGLLLTWGNYFAKQSYVFGVIVIVIFLSIILYEHIKARKKPF